MRVAAWLARIGIALCLLALTLLLLGLVILPMVMGWQAYSVHTNDMAPTVPSGSQMYVRPLRGDEAITVKARDVIAYSPKNDPQDTVVKRVTRVDGEGAGRSWTVRGDANKEESVVRPDQLRGPVALFVPYLGTIADLLAKQPLVMGGCLLGSLMLFSAMVLWSKHITAKRDLAATSASAPPAHDAGRSPAGTRPPSTPATMPPTPGTRPQVGGRSTAQDPNGRPPSQSLPTVHDVAPSGTGSGAIIDSRPISGGQPVAPPSHAPRSGAGAATGGQSAAGPRTGSQPAQHPGSAPRTGSQPVAQRPVPVSPPPHPDHGPYQGEDAHLAAWGQTPHPDGPRPIDDAAAPPQPPAGAPPRPGGAYVIAVPPQEGRGGYAPYTPQSSGYSTSSGAPLPSQADARADDRRRYDDRQAEELRRFEEQRRAEEDYRRREEQYREEQRRADEDHRHHRPEPLEAWRAVDDDPNKTELQRIFEAALRERGLPVPPPTSDSPLGQPQDQRARDARELGRGAGSSRDGAGRDSYGDRAREQGRDPRRESGRSAGGRPAPVEDLSGPPTGFFLQVLAESGMGPQNRAGTSSHPDPRSRQQHDPRPDSRPQPRLEPRADPRAEQRNDPRREHRPEAGRGMDSLSLLESWRSYGEANPQSEAARSLFPEDHASGWGSSQSGVQPHVGPDGLRTWGQPIVPELRPHAGYGNESRYQPEPTTKPPITGAMRRISSTQYVFEDDPRTSGNSTIADPDRSGPLSLFRRRQDSSSDPKRGRRGS